MGSVVAHTPPVLKLYVGPGIGSSIYGDALSLKKTRLNHHSVMLLVHFRDVATIYHDVEARDNS